MLMMNATAHAVNELSWVGVHRLCDGLGQPTDCVSASLSGVGSASGWVAARESRRADLASRSGEIARFGGNGEFVLKLAVTEVDRLAAWQLVYREYLELGYVREQVSPYRYSIHDALPGAATFLIEQAGEAVGTVSVYPDSPVGLPADEVYRSELEALRNAGRQVVEIGRLTIRRDHANNRQVLMNLLDALSLYARCIRMATDLIITVNPSHARFYERAILFERIGEEQGLGSVCGAPAVLLRLDLGLEIQVRRYAHGEGPRPEGPIGRHTVYPHISGLEEETKRVARMRRAFVRPGEEFVWRHFVQVRPLIQNASPAARRFFQECYPALGLSWPVEDAVTV